MTHTASAGVGDYFDDNGSVEIGGTDFKNANNEGSAPVNLQQALTVSSDAYFYTVGDDFWHVWQGGDEQRGLGHPDEARELGFGAADRHRARRGDGRVPDPKWKTDFAHTYYKTKKDQEARTASGTRATTSSRRSARATSSSRRCSSPTRTPRSRTAARCGQPHIADAGHRLETDKLVDGRRRRRSARSRSIRRRARTMLAGFAGAVANRRAPRTPRSRASRSTGSRRGQDRHRAGRGQGRHVAVRGVLPGSANRSTSWSPSSSRPATARRPRRRSCAAIIEAMNHLPTPPVADRQPRRRASD